MSERPMKKVMVRLYESDLEYLKQNFSHMGYNRAIRMLISDFVKKNKARENEVMDELQLSEVEV